MTLVTGAGYPAMALLFAYGISGFMSTDIAYIRSNSNLIGLMWLVVSIVELFAYGLYAWTLGYASERMVNLIQIELISRCVESGCRVFERFCDRMLHSLIATSIPQER